ncbi:hypothetical protein Tco_0771619 [Tanacetum coccineum]|uniref:Uncharacterized protein n=1 Tax=Tanacetum coccineum TaxID=301880 RepID=A0ABQ4ZJB5_9ASTR
MVRVRSEFEFAHTKRLASGVDVVLKGAARVFVPKGLRLAVKPHAQRCDVGRYPFIGKFPNTRYIQGLWVLADKIVLQTARSSASLVVVLCILDAYLSSSSRHRECGSVGMGCCTGLHEIAMADLRKKSTIASLNGCCGFSSVDGESETYTFQGFVCRGCRVLFALAWMDFHELVIAGDLLSIENGVTRTKKYAELSVVEKIQVDCDMKATNIILQVLPADIYSLVVMHLELLRGERVKGYLVLAIRVMILVMGEIGGNKCAPVDRARVVKSPKLCSLKVKTLWLGNALSPLNDQGKCVAWHRNKQC